MHIRVDRYLSNTEATLSKIYLDGVFFCYGLEDQYQEVKVQDETRIPAGTYKIKLRTTGGLHKRYGVRYSFHKGMLHVQDVPGFTYVYVHTGNTADHTSACLLVGQGRNEDALILTSSRHAYKRLYEAVIDAAENDDLTITYEDNDSKLKDLPAKPESLTLSQAPAFKYIGAYK